MTRKTFQVLFLKTNRNHSLKFSDRRWQAAQDLMMQLDHSHRATQMLLVSLLNCNDSIYCYPFTVQVTVLLVSLGKEGNWLDLKISSCTVVMKREMFKHLFHFDIFLLHFYIYLKFFLQSILNLILYITLNCISIDMNHHIL